MAIFNQIESFNFRDKKVMIVVTHEGSGLGNIVKDLDGTCLGVEFGLCLVIQDKESEKSKDKVFSWANSI